MPSAPLRLALAQATSVRGDVDVNLAKAASTITAAAARGAHVVAGSDDALLVIELDPAQLQRYRAGA